MKRSRWLKLAALGSAPLVLSGCDSDREAYVFPTADACIAANVVPEAVCREDFARAEANHFQTAPRFLSKADCEADFGSGQCTTRSEGGGSFFVPFMSGYMIASLLRDRPDWISAGSHYRSPRPLYRTRGDSNFRTSDNIVIGSNTGAAKVSQAASAPATRAVTMSRSGFGSTASARGGWGG
jgi:uncharacterized protein YgiB involved in biofilm formation